MPIALEGAGVAWEWGARAPSLSRFFPVAASVTFPLSSRPFTQCCLPLPAADPRLLSR